MKAAFSDKPVSSPHKTVVMARPSAKEVCYLTNSDLTKMAQGAQNCIFGPVG